MTIPGSVSVTHPAGRQLSRESYIARLNAPSSRRFFVRFTAAFVALTVLTVGLVVVRATRFSPEAAIRSYFEALQRRDASDLWSTADPTNRVTATSRTVFAELLRDSGYTPPSDVEITTVSTDGDIATVDAVVTIGSTKQAAVYSLQRDEASLYKVFRPWHLNNAFYGVTHNWDYSYAATSLIVAGQAFSSDSPNFTLLPGVYTVSVAENPLLDARTTATIGPDGSTNYIDLQPTIKPEVATAVSRGVDVLVEQCRTGSPDIPQQNCPFNFNPDRYIETFQSISWTITQQPAAVPVLGLNSIQAQTTVSGKASYSAIYTDSSGQPYAPVTGTEDFSVDGAVTVNGATVDYQFGG